MPKIKLPGESKLSGALAHNMTSATPKPRAGEHTAIRGASPLSHSGQSEPAIPFIRGAIGRLLMSAASYKGLWLICHEHTPHEPKGNENMQLGYQRGALFGSIEAANIEYHQLEAERNDLRKALERINLRFYNFDNQHPSLATNEAARQLLADIEADISGALAKAPA